VLIDCDSASSDEHLSITSSLKKEVDEDEEDKEYSGNDTKVTAY
jgi:hypothetical protein